jgi:hypothetical protein
MYQRASYSVITTSIDKVAFYYHYPNWNEDVYSLLVQNAIERYFYFLRANGGVGDVMAEAVGDKPDKALRVRYAWAYENGTEHISAHKLQRRLTSREIKIKPRSDDISGLQMADLLAKTCFDHCRRVYTGYGPPRGFSARVATFLETEKYYRRPDGDPDTYGRVWRPKRAKMKNGPGFRGRPSSRLSLQLCVGVTTI